jgi:hypothetical protein
VPTFDNVSQTLSVIDPRRPENRRTESSREASFTWNGPKPKRVSVPKVEFSLGWELEANNEAARYPNGIEKISDGSVNGDSAEYVVLPSVTKSPRFVLGLLKELVHAPELNTDKSCGFHVHLAPRKASLAKSREWALACQRLALAVEGEAFRAVPETRQENSYCRKVSILQHGTRFQNSKYGNDLRYQWLNVVEMFRPGGIRTVEVRLLGNTHRWKYLLAWATFCLVLGKQAWVVIHKPESFDDSVKALKSLLLGIAEEVRPLDKRGEPIPEWVYKHLKGLGIEYTAWERPLAKLSAIECELTGRSKRYYSDNQPTIESNDDDNLCECGCGEDGRCYDQMHNDGDCDSDECIACHREGNCSNDETCVNCREARHDSGEFCGYQRCNACYRNGRIPRELPLETPSTDTLNGATIERVSIDESVNVGTGIDNPSNYAPVTSEAYRGTAGEIAEREAARLIDAFPITNEERSESEVRENYIRIYGIASYRQTYGGTR